MLHVAALIILFKSGLHSLLFVGGTWASTLGAVIWFSLCSFLARYLLRRRYICLSNCLKLLHPLALLCLALTASARGEPHLRRGGARLTRFAADGCDVCLVFAPRLFKTLQYVYVVVDLCVLFMAVVCFVFSSNVFC